MAQINRLKIQAMASQFVKQIHRAGDLNLSVRSAGFEEVTLFMPYQQHVVADQQSGKVCRSALIRLIDTAASACALCTFFYLMHHILAPFPADMRVDYIHQVSMGVPLMAQAQRFYFISELLMIRIMVYQHFIEVPIACAWVSFECSKAHQVSEQVKATLLGERE